MARPVGESSSRMEIKRVICSLRRSIICRSKPARLSAICVLAGAGLGSQNCGLRNCAIEIAPTTWLQNKVLRDHAKSISYQPKHLSVNDSRNRADGATRVSIPVVQYHFGCTGRAGVARVLERLCPSQ